MDINNIVKSRLSADRPYKLMRFEAAFELDRQKWRHMPRPNMGPFEMKVSKLNDVAPSGFNELKLLFISRRQEDR